MLIWKVIAANPGITRAEIWERVEHSIPEGYALRAHAAELRKKKPRERTAALGLARARGYVLTFRLQQMRQSGNVTWDGDGRARRYAATRQPHYRGNPDAIDETGTRAAEHMAVADALRTAEKWLARADPDRVARNGKRGPVIGPPSRKEYEAVLLVVKTLRAQGGAGA
jgi:hypothetical protein